MNRIAFAAVSALTLAAVAAPAAATETGLAYNGNKSVELTLRGDVSPRCGIVAAPETRVDLGNLAGSGRRSLGFTIDCNGPVAYTLTSKNGALTNVDLKGAAPAGFAASVAYAVTVAGDLGFNGDTRHASRTLTGAGQGRTSTETPFEQDLALDLEWNAGGALMAGRYEDVITLRIGGGS